MSVVLGLDPGMDGAAVAMTDDENVFVRGWDQGRWGPILFRDYTIAAPSRGRQYDHARLAKDLWHFVGGEDPLCVLEQGRGQPGASSSSLAIGLGFGLLLGIIAANGWRVVIVQPAVWHRALFGKHAVGAPKERALAYARDRIPLFDATLGGRFRKPHQGLIDAACLASYGMRKAAE